MPSPHERHRNNIKMGLFVSASLLLALGVVVALTDAWAMLTTTKTQYTVSFPLQSGVSNLKSGSEVRVGGVKLGDVVAVKPRFIEGEPFEYIDVVFSLDSNVELYNEAIVMVTAPLIGADAWIDIPSVGDPTKGYPSNNQLEGVDRAGAMTTLLGATNAARADEVIENIRQFTTMLARLPQDYDERVVPIMDSVGIFTTDAKALIAGFRHENWPSWKASVDAVVANVVATSENMQDFMAWVNAEGREKVIEVLDTGHSALARTDSVLDTLRRDYDVWATELGAVMANSSHASQQLKLAMTEIRRAPWKLIHVPGKEELEHELLYDSVRAFAMAAADLKTAAASVQRVLDTHGEMLAGDAEAMERLKQNLINPLAIYEQAQQRLLDVLLEK